MRLFVLARSVGDRRLEQRKEGLPVGFGVTETEVGRFSLQSGMNEPPPHRCRMCRYDSKDKVMSQTYRI